jgi:membrane-bound serine protease (ClpP class)
MLSRWLLALSLCAIVSGPSCARPPEREPPDAGIFVTVANPITSASVNQIKETVTRAIQRNPLKKIVFDFNPSGKEAATPDFGPCLDLARYIKSVRGEKNVLTIAFVKSKVTRHTVLPVLACDELVMAPDAAIGAVSPNPGATPDKVDVVNYESFVLPSQSALVLKMLDSQVEVLKGERNNAAWYIDARKEADAAREGVVIADKKPVLRAGELGLYRANDALKFQLCKAILASRQQIETRYNMPPGSHREDVLMDRNRVCWRLTVQGEVTGGLQSSLTRQLERATKRGANLIVLQLECGGGSTSTARDIAEQLRGLRTPDGQPVMTVAFIPFNAGDSATFIALGCNEIVMTQSARFGDFAGLLNPPKPKRGQPAPPVDIGSVRDALAQLAEEQNYSPTLIRGLFDEQLEIVRAKRVKGAINERRFLTPDELKEKDETGQPVWVAEDTVKHAGKALVINGSNAISLGFARHVIDKPDNINELYRFYGIEPNQVREAGPDWLDRFASFLADPFVASFLVLVGISCLLLELKMPGASLPGIVAAVCFVLFFWSQSQLNGQITLLAVLFFLLGLLLLGLEIFVVPGFGIFGISGVGLILFGLALATVERMPQSPADWGVLGTSIVKFGLALVGAIAVAFTLTRYLPNIPIANRLLLPSPDEEEHLDPVRAAQAAEALALLGAIGTSATMLRPAGMAQFGERFLDVVTEGSFVPAGAQVQVVEIEGNRIVVKEV